MKGNWSTKKLGEIVEFISGNQNINKDKTNPTGKYPAYSASGQDIFLETYEHEGPAIIVSWIGARCGKCFLADGKWTAIANTQILKIKNENECDYKYLFYFLNDEKKWPRIGGAQPYISKNGAKRIEIPLPPLEIQKRIVARIEELFEKIDKAKQLREKALEETEQIFQSALQEIFEKAEKKWGRKTLGEIIELHYGKGIPQKDRKTDGKYPIYGANGELGRTDKYLVEGEAIIIGRKGTAGAVNRVSGRFWPADVTYYVFGNEKIDIDFLFYAFKKIDLSQLATGIKPGISRNKVYELQIPLPPLSEQKKIVAYLDNLREKIEKLKQLQQKQLEELTELKNSILEKAFTGELI
jgi:type I restriction enzyme S subunit